MEINVQTARQLRLTDEEFELIKKIMGRTPNFTELCAYSVMWSEHCSYKNSIKWLKTLPRDGKRMLVKAGDENAGLMDIGNGYGVVFKIESHNHPSAIEPFQGAATGVGGIHRDIFTMGARPIAALNSLRFGNLNEAKTQHLVAGVVHGIGHYGNCFGVPTVGGETYFEERYHTNPLVNAMSVGIVKNGETVSATAEGIGNPVFIVGSATGKDGMGGASFASADITAGSVEELPAVQVGDPFQEKKLLEACLEIIKTGAVVGMQDMGAAGIICSTAEMSAKGGTGMEINLSQVPTRQKNMKAWELLLSESQERMLVVIEKGREESVLTIFDKWDLPCQQIGKVTDTGLLQFYMNGELEAVLHAESLVLGGGAPQNDREYREPAYFEKIKAFDPQSILLSEDIKSVARKLIQIPNIAGKRWIYNQYDSMVGAANLSTNAPSDASIVLAKGTGKALAIRVDCNSRYVFADPYKGAMIAVAEAARNIVCSGGEPIGVTNCLNFGNPFDPEVYYQFVYAVKGMGEACRKFDTPVTGGNVSFYNQNPDGAVYPTPTIGMVGVLDDLTDKMTMDFKQQGDVIYLIGKSRNDINCSEYLHKIKRVEYSPAPYFDIEEEFEIQQAIKQLIKKRLLQSAHDISEGGLITALLESGFPRHLGFDVQQSATNIRKDAYWFGEVQSRVVISCTIKNAEELLLQLNDLNIPHEYLGIVTESNIDMEGEYWGHINQWKEWYDTAIERMLVAPALKGGERKEEAPALKRGETEENLRSPSGELRQSLPLGAGGRHLIVTGAAGFIGSCMVQYLNEQGYENLILVDDFGVEEKRKNWEGKKFEAIVERYNLFDWLEQHNPAIDFVIHLGARTDTTEFNYAIHQELNVEYSQQVWNYCTKKQIPLIYASSAATYGGGELGYDDKKDVENLHPLNPYGISKNEFDKWALHQQNCPPFWAGLKFFNVYGPNEYHKGRMASVIFHACNQIKKDGVVKLFKSHKEGFEDGQQLRDFIYVKDVVKVIGWMMQQYKMKDESWEMTEENRLSSVVHRASSLNTHPSTVNSQLSPGIYNLGTGSARTFEDLVKATFKGLDLDPAIKYIDMPEDIRERYQYYTEANMQKLRETGYSNDFYSLEEGVDDYVRNYLAKNRIY